MEGGMGDDASGDRPPSEISVLEDSAPGEVTGAFQPKKLLILFPGVLGSCCFESNELADAFRAPAESIRRGGGRLEGGCRAIAVWEEAMVAGGEGDEGRTGINGSLTRRLCRRVPFENCEP